jgi:hypothetical protein
MSVAIALTIGLGLIAAMFVMLIHAGMPRLRFSPGVGFFGAWLLFMALYTAAGRLLIEADGLVVARQTVYDPRRATVYTMRTPSGRSFSLESGATDASLSRDLPVGSRVTKRKWDLAYTVDGRTVSDFSTTFYGIVFAIGASFVWLSIALIIQRRRQPGLTKRWS